MQIKCKNCGCSVFISAKAWIKHLISAQRILCNTCQGVKKWEAESRLLPGCALFDVSEECIIRKYSDDLYDRISCDLAGERCAIRDKKGSDFVCTVSKIENGYISCLREDPFNDQFTIPVCHVERYIKIDKKCTKFNQCISAPVLGYKGVQLCNGILGDKKYIYEVGVPYIEKRKSPFAIDFQDAYSHFCLKIENVLGWRDFLSTAVNGCSGVEYRLFLVKGEGHCFENTPGNWVSNHLTLLREVSQNEILQYFSEHDIPKYYTDALALYRTATITPYTNILSRDEIEKILDSNIWWSTCNGLSENCISNCDNHRCKHEVLREYCYLMLRLYIQNGTFSCECFEHRFLENNKFERELSGIRRLLNNTAHPCPTDPLEVK